MKKYVLTLCILLTVASLRSFAQKLEENKKDEFSNKSIKRTSWETLYKTLTTESHFSFSKVDTSAFIHVKLMIGNVFSIDKDQELMLKLDNGDIVKLLNTKFEVTCEGCGAVGFIGSGAQGLDVAYWIAKDQLDKLKAHKVVKVRIYTNEGYIEQDIKDKNANKITACVNLIS